MNQGRLFVISGASGVGKGTILKLIMKERPVLSFSVSATTRSPRPNEVDGKHYHFVTPEQFERMIDENAFLEYDRHNKCCYGTPRAQIEEKRKNGHVLLDIEPKGAKQVKEAVPDAVLIFIMPPHADDLEHRLRGRGDTPEDQIEIRLERAKWEMEQRCWYDYVVVNDVADRCAQEILAIIDKY